MQPRIGTLACIDLAQVFDVANSEIAATRRGTAYRRRSRCFTNYERKSCCLGGSVRLSRHGLNASITGPRKSEMGYVNAPHLSSFIVNMAATIGVTMNRFSRNRVCHRPKRRIGFGCEMRFGSPEIEQPNKYLRVVDKFALFCKPQKRNDFVQRLVQR
jgi:hypothetical protein